MKKIRKMIREWIIQLFIGGEKVVDVLLWNLLSIGNRKECIAPKKCHFLILNDARYLKAGKIAIHSFLARNKEFVAVIHTDAMLLKAVSDFASKSIFKKRIQIVQLNSDVHWTEQKYRLLMSMQHENDLYLDVDTRCNKRIEIGKQVTCFVDEGDLLKQEPYSSILKILPDDSFPEKSRMLNTTFFTWNGQSLPDNSVGLEWFNDISRGATVYSKERLAEQIMVSILVANNFPNYEVLKKFDSSFDRGVIESSYLGATGRFIYRR